MNMKLLIIFIFFIVMSEASALPCMTIEVQQKTIVKNEHVRLGDIAHISGGDQKFMQRLGALIISKAPLPGKTRSLTARYIRLRLKQADINIGQVKLVVPEKAIITRSSITISKEKIAGIVSAYIKKKFAGRGDEIILKSVVVQKDLLLPKGKVAYRIINKKQAGFSGCMAVYVDFTVDGYFHEKIRAIVDIETLANVVVAIRPLGRHKIITQADISVKRIDISKLQVNIISDPEKVIGRRTKRSIDPATVLRTDLVELPPIVKRGDVVTIIAEAGGMRITALGKVKKKGHKGERLKVINLNSKKVIYARVVDANTVRVTF
ncbi:MAG: flagellar basal body P-ring formation protein FlgA [Deltaproteobacteria bacterium]|nr:flagellar basal body P-ring formation protein FlgA [Deltaproteobacteria bacterium]